MAGPRVRNTEMPNLFVIGAMKSGTTSLHRYLDLHPEISMSWEKEPNYFLPEGSPGVDQRVNDRKAYLNLFDSGMSVRGESSTSYSRYPQLTGVAAATAAAAPQARLVYLLRDPIERVGAEIREYLSARLGDAKHVPRRFRPSTWSGISTIPRIASSARVAT